MTFEIILLGTSMLLMLAWYVQSRKESRAQRPVRMRTRAMLSLSLILLLIAVVRIFVSEPFRIPSQSMLPTLKTGDIISVSKSAYGISIPGTGWVIAESLPERGDVVVFEAPRFDGHFLIKRVIGLPGDIVEYRGRTLSINGKVVPYVRGMSYVGTGSDSSLTGSRQGIELLPGREHALLPGDGKQYTTRGQGQWQVPQGQVFLMGDNRDMSEDSRYWGALRLDAIRGRATKVMVNIDQDFDTSRSGQAIQ